MSLFSTIEDEAFTAQHFCALCVLSGFLIRCLLPSPVWARDVRIGHFSASDLSGWEPKAFSGKTDYGFTRVDGTVVLRADSRNSASGLVRKIRVDLRKTPFLNWRWRINQHLPVTDETAKSGDDYSARVYVVVDGGILPWRTCAVTYVWSAASEKGAVWANAFAGKSVMMTALRSRQDTVHTWFSEKQNIREDMQRLLGRSVDIIDAVAVMTDTDNHGGRATAFYGDIFFSDQ